jgi:hypothetical protein
MKLNRRTFAATKMLSKVAMQKKQKIMKFEKAKFEEAKALLFGIDTECPCSVWNKDGQYEKEYRALKHALRAWDYAIVFNYMDESGEVLVDSESIDLARDYEKNGSSVDWNGPLHKKYSNDEEYRVKVNAGLKILEIEGINDLDTAKKIYDTYKGIVTTVKIVGGKNYSEKVIEGTYYE